MRVARHILFLIGIFGFPVVASAAENDPVAAVRVFIAAIATDKTAAGAMVAPDAQFGAGDVGGPFDLSIFDVFDRDCKFDTASPVIRPLGMEGRNIILVEVAMNCAPEGHPPTSAPADFMVENGKIAGLYLPMKSGLMSEPTIEEGEK